MAAAPTMMDLVSLREDICSSSFVDAYRSEGGSWRWNGDASNPEGY
jgi:hypothetical protein